MPHKHKIHSRTPSVAEEDPLGYAAAAGVDVNIHSKIHSTNDDSTLSRSESLRESLLTPAERAHMHEHDHPLHQHVKANTHTHTAHTHHHPEKRGRTFTEMSVATVRSAVVAMKEKLPQQTEKPAKVSWYEALVLMAYVSGWFIFGVIYNLDSKLALNLTHKKVPLCIAWTQIVAGCFFFLPAWFFGFKKAPVIESWPGFWRHIVTQGACHIVLQAGQVLATNIGSVALLQILRAIEPVYTAIFSVFVFGEVFHILTYLSLIPLVGGVILASTGGGMSFSVAAFVIGNIANLGAVARNMFGKGVMKNEKLVGRNLDASNIYALICLTSGAMLLPIVLYVEGNIIFGGELWTDINKNGWEDAQYIMFVVVRAAVLYYVVNELSYNVLGLVNQVTYAVTNTLRRVAIIYGDVFVIGTALSMTSQVGSMVAVLGTLMYSLCKTKFG